MEVLKTNLLNYCDDLDNFYIIHCISNDWALGAGIALQLKNKYKITKPSFETSVGTCVFSPIFIANLITKSKYWMKPSYDSLEMSLKSLRRQLGNDFNKTLIMPKIGCGLDKLEWNEVSKLIEKYLSDFDVRVCIL